MKFLILLMLSLPAFAQSNFQQENVSFIVLNKYERIPNNSRLIRNKFFAFNPEIKQVYISEQIWNRYNKKQKVYFVKKVINMINKPIDLKPIEIPKNKRFLMI